MTPSAKKTLYIRGVPDRLLRKAKALAAEKGTTLTALVLGALEREVSPGEAVTPDPTAGLAREQAWFEAHREELAETYDGQYVAVVGERVVDHDRDFGELARRTLARFGRRPVLLPRCGRDSRTVRLRGPRARR